MSQKYENKEALISLTDRLIPAGAIGVAIFGMFMVSIGIVLLTGIIFGDSQPLTAKRIPHKKSVEVVIVSYSKPLVEQEVKQSQLATPELPVQTSYQKLSSLLTFQIPKFMHDSQLAIALE